ncbi:MAG: hypothetical protein OEN01_01730 [Candidatus Krumholzibacteria bacterium]|nr:hypothetical protein [Candidatus Krumholzibacteria bacterium]
MFRTSAAVLAGYLVMALLVFAVFSIAYTLMGPDGAFRPGSFDVSTLWLVVSVVGGLLAAIVGGVVCSVISRNSKGPVALAAVVLVLGLVMAVPVLTSTEDSQPAAREGDVGNIEAMNQAEQPPWLVLANPFIGALGVMIGSRLKRSAPRSSS